MVRLYVSTGEPRYREYYDEILAIREGTASRPVGYDSSFWDRVLAEGTGFVEYGPRESLVDQMRAADVTPAEFAALSTSLRTSDRLAQLERDVMDRVSARIDVGVDETYAADVAPEYDAVGFRADAAVDGSDALEMFRSGEHAIVLTDLHMPRLTGYELAVAIRRHEASVGHGGRRSWRSAPM